MPCPCACRYGMAGANSLNWTSTYATMSAPMYDLGTVDAMNERGLVGNLLYFSEVGGPSPGSKGGRGGAGRLRPGPHLSPPAEPVPCRSSLPRRLRPGCFRACPAAACLTAPPPPARPPPTGLLRQRHRRRQAPSLHLHAAAVRGRQLRHRGRGGESCPHHHQQQQLARPARLPGSE